MTAKPYRLENWDAEDLEYLGGPFVSGHLSREVAAKEWNLLSSAFGSADTAKVTDELQLPYRPKPNRPMAGSEASWARWSAEEDEFREHGAKAYDKPEYTHFDDSDYVTPPGSRRQVAGPNYDDEGRLTAASAKPGKRASAETRQHIPRNTWGLGGVTEWFASLQHREYASEAHRLTGIPTNTPPVKWSQRQVRCSICFGELPEGRRRYCSDACEAKRRRKPEAALRIGHVPAAELRSIHVDIRKINRRRQSLPHCYLNPPRTMPVAS